MEVTEVVYPKTLLLTQRNYDEGAKKYLRLIR